MKKLFIVLALVAVSITASAKGFVGGELGLWRNYDANTTSFKILPTVGYDLNSKWTIGGSIGYGYDYNKGADAHSFIISPFARYNAVSFGPVTIFADGGLTYSLTDWEGPGSNNSWEVGIKPGVKVNLHKNISFVSHWGFLGWRENDGTRFMPQGETGFGFDFSGNSLTVGMSYDF